MKVHAEIEYKRKGKVNIHSDICPPDCNFENVDEEYKENLHEILNEWLENSNGTGIFYIGEEGMVRMMKDYEK